MPASGMPVASTITSMPGHAISASASAVTWVRALLHRVVEGRRGKLLGRPAGGGELASRALDVEIGDRDDVQAARQPRLRQEHGAEFPGADQADGDRAACDFTFEQESVEVHAECLSKLDHRVHGASRWPGDRPLRGHFAGTTSE